MSKTYKHQMMWENGNYWLNYSYWLIYQEPKDINSPSYKYPGYHWMSIEVRRRKWLQTNSHRQCRRKVKHLLYKKKWTEAKHVKPRNIAWEIW